MRGTDRVKIGVNLLNFGAGADPVSLGRWARLAEDLGYHVLMISDHVAITPDVAVHYPAPFYDPFLTLAWLASQVRSIELGTTVIILPYRHPLQVARLTSNLDQLTGGRLILGVGAGWAAEEFAALGVSFADRGAITDDALAVIRTSWTTDVISHRSPFVAFDDVATAPGPVRAPHPPIWVGGNGPAGRRPGGPLRRGLASDRDPCRLAPRGGHPTLGGDSACGWDADARALSTDQALAHRRATRRAAAAGRPGDA